MNLVSPVTILFMEHEITFTKLRLVIVDDCVLKTVQAHIRPLPTPMTLWEGESYDHAGDYTQAEVEARVLEILGSDLGAGLSALA